MRTPAIPLFRPFAYLRDVTQISPQILVEEGYIAALIDIDNTLVPRSTHVLFEDVENWVGELKAAGLKVCLLSNNWHRTVFGYAERLGVPIVYKAMKPLPFAYLRALDKIALKRARSSGRALGFAQNSLGVESSSGRALGFGQNSPGVDLGIGKVAVIGDQLLTDVLGARLLGLNPILVEPLSTTDLWYTQLFRRVERVLLNDMRPLG